MVSLACRLWSSGPASACRKHKQASVSSGLPWSDYVGSVPCVYVCLLAGEASAQRMGWGLHKAGWEGRPGLLGHLCCDAGITALPQLLEEKAELTPPFLRWKAVVVLKGFG